MKYYILTYMYDEIVNRTHYTVGCGYIPIDGGSHIWIIERAFGDIVTLKDS